MRKKIIFFTLSAVILATTAYSLIYTPSRHAATATPNRSIAPPPKITFAQMEAPTELAVPKLSLKAPITKVGVTKEGNMDVPPSESMLGWYEGGVFPGNVGPAVLAGHTGRPEQPSVFRQLDQLHTKDTITIKDTTGTEASFEITEITSYTPESAPRERIFGPTTNRQLVIITCSGTWLPHQNTYSHRLVLYAVRTQ